MRIEVIKSQTASTTSAVILNLGGIPTNRFADVKQDVNQRRSAAFIEGAVINTRPRGRLVFDNNCVMVS